MHAGNIEPTVLKGRTLIIVGLLVSTTTFLLGKFSDSVIAFRLIPFSILPLITGCLEILIRKLILNTKSVEISKVKLRLSILIMWIFGGELLLFDRFWRNAYQSIWLEIALYTYNFILGAYLFTGLYVESELTSQNN